MILHQMVVQGSYDCTRKAVSYRKECKRMINKKRNKFKGIFDWIRNQPLNSVWIKDLTMLYYSILDDESI